MDSASTALRDFLTSARWYQLLVVVGTLIGSCFFVASLVKEDQPLVTLMLFAAALIFPAAITNPRWGLFIFLWLAHTIDGAKRVIYTFTNFTQREIAWILIVPVLIAGALYIRVLLLSWFGAGMVERVKLMRFWPLVLAISGAVAFTLRGGLTFEALAANYTLLCYIPAGIIVPHIIYNSERRMAYVKCLIWIAVVVGCYGLLQSIHGPFAYEIEYMLSGLTITVGSYEGQAFFRAFSLLNNGPTFCGVMIMITLLSYYYFCRKEGRIHLNRPVVLMTLFTTVVCFAATQRGPLISFFVTLALVPLFTRPRAFFTTLGVGLAVFIGMIVFADQVMEKLQVANEVLVTSSDSALVQQNAQILTYGQRLNGFSALKDPNFWTPFGMTSRMGQSNYLANDMASSHDLISNFIEWFGWVGTGSFLIFCAAFVYMVIIRVRSMQSNPLRSMWAQCNLGVFLFMMIWQLFTGPALMVSPLQFYFWVAIGNVIYLLTEPEDAPAEDPAAGSQEVRGLWRPRQPMGASGQQPV